MDQETNIMDGEQDIVRGVPQREARHIIKIGEL